MARDRATVAFRAASSVARALPARMATAVAEAGGRSVARLRTERRAQVERNLRRIDPTLRGPALDRAVRATFASYARYWVESFRLPDRTPAELDARFRHDGYEHIAAARAAGRGAILALPHLGNWEWAGFWLTEVAGDPITVVVERLDPPELFEWFVDLRRRFGFEVVALGPDAAAACSRALRENRVLALLCDRDLSGAGIDVELFGERTTLPGGPATLALRTGAPLLPTAVYFDGDGCRGVVRPPLPAERTGRLRDDVARVTQALADELAALIRVAPDQWHLMQPNWPSDRAPNAGGPA